VAQLLFLQRSAERPGLWWVQTKDAGQILQTLGYVQGRGGKCLAMTLGRRTGHSKR
jgi:hypothetical protein